VDSGKWLVDNGFYGLAKEVLAVLIEAVKIF